eukprot:5081879-Prorocentrum_lima.AAC.1
MRGVIQDVVRVLPATPGWKAACIGGKASDWNFEATPYDVFASTICDFGSSKALLGWSAVDGVPRNT